MLKQQLTHIWPFWNSPPLQVLWTINGIIIDLFHYRYPWFHSTLFSNCFDISSFYNLVAVCYYVEIACRYLFNKYWTRIWKQQLPASTFSFSLSLNMPLMAYLLEGTMRDWKMSDVLLGLMLKVMSYFWKLIVSNNAYPYFWCWGRIKKECGRIYRSSKNTK